MFFDLAMGFVPKPGVPSCRHIHVFHSPMGVINPFSIISFVSFHHHLNRQTHTKTKYYVYSGFAYRSTRVEQHGKIVSLCGGAITGALGVAPVVKKSVANAAKARGARDFGEHAA